MYVVILGNDPKEQCGTENSETKEEAKPIQVCTCGHLGLILLRTLRNCGTSFKLCLKWLKWGVFIHWLPCLGQGCPVGWVLTFLHSQVCSGMLQNQKKMGGMFPHRCPSAGNREALSSPEQKVRDPWCTLGEVLSCFFHLHNSEYNSNSSSEHGAGEARGRTQGRHAWHN